MIGGYDQDLSSAQDGDFHIRLALEGAKVSYCKGVFFYHRKVGDSISSNWVSVSDNQCKVILNNKKRILNSPELSTQICNHITLTYYNTILYKNDPYYISELHFWKGKASSNQFIKSKLKRIILYLGGLNLLLKVDKLILGFKKYKR